MRLHSILFGQATRLVKYRNPLGGIYMADVIPALQERYKFVEVPASLKEYTATDKPMEFGHGKFPIMMEGKRQRDILVPKLQIFQNGIVAQTNAGSEYADMALEDILNWLKQKFEIEIIDESIEKRTFTSHVEVELAIALDQFLSPLKLIVDELRTAFGKYGQRLPSYEVTSFALNYDLKKIELPQPAAFQLERRANQPFESNLYFSAAPLKTPDHLELLSKLEKLAAVKLS